MSSTVDSDSDDDDEENVLPTNGTAKDVVQEDPGENDNVKVTGPDGDVPTASSPAEALHEAPKVPAVAEPAAARELATTTEPAATTDAPSTEHELKREHDAPAPLEQKVPAQLHEVHAETKSPSPPAPESNGGHSQDDAESEELCMPGSYNTRATPAENGHHHHGWADFFKKMHLRA